MFDRSLSSILSSLTKLVAKLEAHAAKAVAKAEARRDAARLLTLEAASLDTEASQATRVAERVAKLLA